MTIYCGQKGRAVLRLDIVRNQGEGTFTDLGAIARQLDEIKRIDKQVEDLRTQLGKAKPEQQANVKLRLEAIERRKEQLAKTAPPTSDPPRSFRSSFHSLDPSVADDPDLKKLQDAYQAKYPDVAPAPMRPMPPHAAVGAPPPLPGRPLVPPLLRPRPPVLAPPPPKPPAP